VQKEQIVGVAVRLAAVFLALYTVRYATGLIQYTSAPPPNTVSPWFIGTIATTHLAAAALLWFFPLAVAKKLIPDLGANQERTPLDIYDIQAVAFSALGLWVLTSAVPDVFYWATYFHQANQAGMNRQLPPASVADIVSTAIHLVVGFWLLFGARGLAGLIRLARHAGH